jgi:hypothetical protein
LLCYKLKQKNWIYAQKGFFISQRRDKNDLVDSDISRFIHLILSFPGGHPLSPANQVSIPHILINKRLDTDLHGRRSF